MTAKKKAKNKKLDPIPTELVVAEMEPGEQLPVPAETKELEPTQPKQVTLNTLENGDMNLGSNQT